MAAVTITVDRDVTKVTDRELLQLYVYAYQLHDHLTTGDPQPNCVTVLRDEILRRGYKSGHIGAVKALLL